MKSQVPIGIVAGESDLVSTPEDILDMRVYLSSQNEVVFYRQEKFGHFGFFMAKDMNWFQSILDDELPKY